MARPARCKLPSRLVRSWGRGISAPRWQGRATPKTCSARSVAACLGAPIGTLLSRWPAPGGSASGTRPWRVPLRSVGSTRDIDPASLTLLAEYVSSQGAGDRALELYMEAKEVDRAADTA